MKITFQNLALVLTLSIAGITSCKKENDNNNTTPVISQGVFVVNEGSFGAGNGSISYLSLTNGVMANNLFETVNGFPLGDLAQSMTIYNNKGYIIVNNSQKVEVVNMNDFSSSQTVTGLQGPRCMVAKGNKGYISDWFSNQVVVIDLSTNAITNTIQVGTGPEQMAIVDNALFVTNVGGFGSDSTVSVINLLTETNAGTIQLGTNPNSIQRDANGKLWVLCAGSTGPDFIGGTADDIGGSLWKINPLTFTVETSYSMMSSDHPIKLQINGSGTTLFYLAGINGYTGKVVKQEVNQTTLTNTAIIQKEFYGLGIDPISGILYGAFVPGFTQNGYIFRYATNHTLLDSAEVGVAPNGFAFN